MTIAEEAPRMSVPGFGPGALPAAALDDELGFEGEPFDALRLTVPATPTATTATTVATTEALALVTPGATTVAAVTVPLPAGSALTGAGHLATTRIAGLIREAGAVVAAAHDSALAAQLALSRLTLAGPAPTGTGTVRPAPTVTPAIAGTPTISVTPAVTGTAITGTPAIATAATPAITAITAATPALPPAVTTAAVPETGPAQAGPAPTGPGTEDDPVTEASFKALARTERRELTAADLAALGRGEIAGVFGPAYDQEGASPDLTLVDPGDRPLLAWVAGLRTHGGASAAGSLHAGLLPLDAASGTDALTTELLTAAGQALRVFALYVGLHLCLADARFVPAAPAEDPDGRPRTGPAHPAPTVTLVGTGADGASRWDGTGGEVVLDVDTIDLLPRPWLAARVLVQAGGRVVAEIRDVAVTVRERPGTQIGPDHGGAVTAFLGRRNAAGERALLNEFHMAHCARGDQGIGLGPEFGAYRGRRATRLPGGGLRLVDRIMASDSRRGDLRGGATHITEYDAAADCWYYADTANASMPNAVYMETSLQSALLLGYYLGATLAEPEEDYSLRNLGGSATVLREVELRDATIRQHSTLMSTNPMPGTALQDFSYSMAVDGEPFYTGESMFGYFNAPALARQTGLDGGRLVPTWLDEVAERGGEAPAVRTIDVAARRADPAAPLCARGQLALLDDVEVVDGGGRHGRGYLRAVRPIDPADWFFTRHFHLDPVIPGSLGVEAVIQAMQEWSVDAGHADGMARPGFVLPVGLTMHWKYRGQLLPSDGTFTLEVHISDVSRRPGRVRVTADASLWKPTMRIYQLTDIAIELRDEGAPSW
ncbi:beta-ketoacyl synthase [Frankia sp. CcI49]|uniref:beta-ketoacyl synthase n=1 Tax=Frankia sp. CcI49 TaxID=1745382 RepID=UPI0009FE3762|nr:beta-ketoacyl synthase [Frankia sp. CcI49]